MLHQSNFLVIFSILALLGGTSSSQAATSAYSPSADFVGTYSVPVQHELSAYAEWKLKDIKWFRNNKNISAQYQLTELLLDEGSQEIKLTGKIDEKSAFFSMNGPTANASCTELKPDQFICLVHFQREKLKFRNDKVFFTKTFKDANEAQKRFEVAQLFSTDPIGILRIEKR
jgi:hypothetical protein